MKYTAIRLAMNLLLIAMIVLAIWAGTRQMKQSQPQQPIAQATGISITVVKGGQEEKRESQTLWTDQEVEMLAKTIWAEAGAIPDKAQQAAIVWCVLNRVDNGGFGGETIAEVLTYPNQFAYYPQTILQDDCINLAKDVLQRWAMEKGGKANVGRTLPEDYYFYDGDGTANHFRQTYERTGKTWDWSLPSPYAQQGAIT